MEKIDRNLKILIGLALVAIIGVSIIGLNTLSEIDKIGLAISQIKIGSQIEKEAVLIIDCGTGSPQEFEMKVKEGTTVFDLLKQSKIALDYTEYDIGIFINAIDGIENNIKEKKNWMYYVNGETANVGAGEYIVKPNDKIEWRYEKVEW